EIRRVVERTQTCPQAADVPDPVERRPEECTAVLCALLRQVSQQLHAVECVPQHGSPTARVTQARANRKRAECGRETERNSESPRQGEAEARMRGAAPQGERERARR